MIVIGDKEVNEGNISVRSRKDGDLGTFAIDDFISKVKEEIDTKAKDIM